MWSLSRITEEDIDEVLAIERVSFGSPWSRGALLSEFGRKDACNYAVRCSDLSGDKPVLDASGIIAYICCRMIADEMHILKIAVSPGWRHKGVALWLLETCLAQAAKKGAGATFLEVRPSNLAAIGLYSKLGFDIVARRPRYYPETREDALVMTKNLL